MSAASDEERSPGPGRFRRFASSITTRLLLSYALLLTMALGVSLFAIRQALHARLDEQVNEELVQEYEEFKKLVGGNDPETGEPFGSDLRAIFKVYFQRNVPGEGETIMSIVDGRPFRTKRAHDAHPLDTDSALLQRWAHLREPERGETQTEGGIARYLAVPIVIDGDVRGTFVVANFPTFEHQEIDEAIRVAVIVAAVVLVVGLALAGGLARRVLAPLRGLTRTARAITYSDLTRRIPVGGSDEIARMATTFNEMLDRLDEAFRAQRRFVDDAGHELRTPITVIRGHLELLEEDPDQRRETVALVLDELDRMNRLVGDLLVLAKSGRPDFLEPEVVDMAVLAEEVRAKARALGDRRWELEVAGSARIVADRQRLTQALMQLADNAVKHTEEGDEIAIGCVADAREASFWVRDTGAGIPYEDQDRIFERFARGRDARRRSSDGAGLGLAIVQAIALAHGGRVELRSRPGGGATFTLVLPVDEATEEIPTGERVRAGT